MSAAKWYIRLGDEVLGPLSEAELSELAGRGGLNPETAVSGDRANWSAAATVPGIVFRPPPPPQPTLLSPSARKPSSPAWLIGAVIIGGIVVLSCGGLLLGILDGNGDSGSPSWATKAPQPVAPTISSDEVSSPGDGADPAPRSQSDTFADWDYGLVPAASPEETREPLSSVPASPASIARLNLQWTDATPELARLASTLPDQTKAAMGFAALAMGTDIYAARVSLRNTGSVPIRIYPQNIRIHFGNETAPVYTIANPSFLQPRVLQPGQATSGLVSYVARMEIGAAMRRGGGAMSYEDPTIQVTYE